MITKILYYTLILPISLLPYPILYFFSDIAYLVIYRFIGYRKKVVFNNLKNSFPKKSKNEIESIMSDFYSHFCDIIIESFKGFTISEKQIRERVVIKNPDFLNHYADRGQSVILVGGHYNNWEICVQAFSMYSTHRCLAIYKKLSNQFFNLKIHKSRSKFGLELISMQETKGAFINESKPKAIVFGSDQNPANPKKAYWLEFLNQDTAVLFGVEKYSKQYKWPVIYVNISKLQRGHYQVEYSLIHENPHNQPYGKITELFTKRLEEDIINDPQYWLWSHKRWKHKR